MLTMLCMVVLGVVGANAQTTPTIDDVKVISSDYTFIADDYTSNGKVKVKVAPNSLMGDYVFTPNGNTVAANKGKSTIAGTEHSNSLRIKNAQDIIGFKVGGPCTITVYGQSHESRCFNANSKTEAGTDIAAGTVNSATFEFTVSSAKTIYINSTGGDLYMAGFTVKMASASDPLLVANPSALTLVATSENKTVSSTFTITGTNLTGTNGTITLDNEVEGMTVTPSTFAVSNGSASQEVTVTYSPSTNLSQTSCNIVVSDGNTTTNVPVTYSAIGVKNYEQRTIDKATTWDFSKTGLTSDVSGLNEPTLYANIGAVVSDDFAADAITYKGAYPFYEGKTCRVQDDNLAFKTSVAGTVKVTFACTNNNSTRTLKVNGEETKFSSSGETVETDPIAVPAGDVTIGASAWVKVFKVEFTPSSAATSETASITSAGYATYVTKNIVDLSSNANVKAFTAKYDAASSTITLTPTTATVPAGTALVLKGAEGSYNFTVGATAEEVANNDLKATTEPLTADGSQWILAKLGDQVGFAPATPETTIPAGKAYLVIKGSASSKGFIGISDGDATGINQISASQNTLNENAPMFNLAGQQVTKAYKGVILQNGKKFINK